MADVLGRSAASVVEAVVVDGKPMARKSLTSADPVARARFARERQLGLRVSHVTGVVPIVGGDDDHLLMPRLRHSLDDRLRDGPLDPVEALRIARRLLVTLRELHALGVVHRDIKPSNLLFDDDGEVFLADFGVAHVDGSDPLTQAGTLVGTLAFMAPEQLRGHAVDGRADVFGLAATLAFAVTGANADDRATVLARAQTKQAPPLLLRFLEQALEDDRDRRPTAVALHLDEAPRSRWRLWAAAIVVALVAAGGAAALRRPEIVVEATTPAAQALAAQVLGDRASIIEGHEHERSANHLVVSDARLASGHRFVVRLHTNDRSLAWIIDARGDEQANADVGVVGEVARALAGEGRDDDDDGLIVAATRGRAYDAIDRHAWSEARLLLARLRTGERSGWLATQQVVCSWWDNDDDDVRRAAEDANGIDLDEVDRTTIDGIVAMVDGDLARARARFIDGLALVPDSTELLYGLFEANFHNGQLDDAVAVARRVHEVHPEFMLTRAHLLEYALDRRQGDLFRQTLDGGHNADDDAFYGAAERLGDGDLVGASRALEGASPDRDRVGYHRQLGCLIDLLAGTTLDEHVCIDPITGDVEVARLSEVQRSAKVLSLVDAATARGIDQVARVDRAALVAGAVGVDADTSAVLTRLVDQLSARELPHARIANGLFGSRPSSDPLVVELRRARAGDPATALRLLQGILQRYDLGPSRSAVAAMTARTAARAGDDRAVVEACDVVLRPTRIGVNPGTLAGACVDLDLDAAGRGALDAKREAALRASREAWLRNGGLR